MAKVHIDPLRVTKFGNKVTQPLVRQVIKETVELSKRWPRAGNPAWTDSHGTLNRHTTGQTYGSPSPHGYVRNDLVYAMAVHEGTPPRLIYARTKRGMNFWWKRKQRPGRKFKVVHHPKTAGSHFLTAPLAIVARRHGFKVTTRIIA